MSLILANTYQIEQIVNTKTNFYIKNDILWAISTVGHPILINFRDSQNLQTHLFSEVGDCKKIDIDSSGRYCCAVSKEGVFVLDSRSLVASKISSDSTLPATCWALPSSYQAPYIFLAYNSGIFAYFSIDSRDDQQLLQFTDRYAKSGKRDQIIHSIHISHLNGDKFLLQMVSKMKIPNANYTYYPYILLFNPQEGKFTIDVSQKMEFNAPLSPELRQVNVDYFTAVTSKSNTYNTFFFYIDPNSTLNKNNMKPIQDLIVSDSELLQIQNVKDYIFIQTKNTVSIYHKQSHQEPVCQIASITLDPEDIFCVDPVTCHFYVINENGFKRYKFNEEYEGIQGFFVWIFNATNNETYLTTENFTPTMLLYIAKSDMQRIKLLTKYIETKDTSQRLKLLLSHQALILYIQYLCENNTPKELDLFTEWSQSMIDQNFLSAKTIETRTSTFGLQVNIHDVRTKTTMFECALEKGDIDEAVKILENVPRDDFATCALRIADKRMEDVVRVTFQRKLLDQKELIPVLMSEHAVQYLPVFLERNIIKENWQSMIFSIQITKCKSEDKIRMSKKFIDILKDKDTNKDQWYNFAVRYWIQSHEYELASDAMFSRGDIRGAAIADADASLNAVLSTKDISKRRSLASDLLRSLPPEYSSNKARDILENKTQDIGLDTLLRFIPDETYVKLLVKPTDEFLNEMDEKISFDHKERVTAQKGIENAHNKLQKEKESRDKFVMAASAKCNICWDSLFKGRCVIFKCGHTFHIECLKKHLSSLGVTETFDPTSCCAFCSFPAPSTVDENILDDETEWVISSDESKKTLTKSALSDFSVIKGFFGK
ncbi:hypothetical protein TVAG_398740 [Trichomonas vaginalis G3]|uniref:RING-type domain-containing protein n=1 Tax=Trichomonas vaginalis (strain ATCC PRA-98 / G3) TaxID=412133 RepID=A2EVG3_TRIV3|nr:vacuolar protein sorting-associated protein 18-like protein family [Trichomonas vaginalis G3]EAY03349.1 hypothetical protein TVAG_398740 [Trichomonas vaginalis G3]KAI5518824.1 vacuolar protein sorting-associated protein 18-like protein family [Trichomonas vaginalis G3]|eukprot:XP_001315572.1 hypothetical protein [Trichomonas vaginalis G3]